MTTQLKQTISTFLNIDIRLISRVEEWNKVFFVVIHGKGGRFVSKKKVVLQPEPDLKVAKIKDTQTGNVVYGIVTSLGGCYETFKTKKQAEKALKNLPAWYVKYWGNSVYGSIIKDYASGRYETIYC